MQVVEKKNLSNIIANGNRQSLIVLLIASFLINDGILLISIELEKNRCSISCWSAEMFHEVMN